MGEELNPDPFGFRAGFRDQLPATKRTHPYSDLADGKGIEPLLPFGRPWLSKPARYRSVTHPLRMSN